MAAEAIKPDIHRLVDSIQGTQSLNAVYTILEKQASTEHDFWLTISLSQQAAIKAGMANADAGRVIPMSDVLQNHQ